MSSYKQNPSEAAAKFKVRKIGEIEYELQSTQDRSNVFKVRRQGARLDFQTNPHKVRWFTDRNKAYYALHLLIEKLEIGYGESGRVADNCFFIIDGEALRYVPLTELYIQSEEQFNLHNADIARMKGDANLAKSEAEATTVNGCARAKLFPSGRRYPDIVDSGGCYQPDFETEAFLECRIGLPKLSFEKLVEDCIKGRVLDVSLHGLVGGLSVECLEGWPREVFLVADKTYDFDISSMSVDYRLTP